MRSKDLNTLEQFLREYGSKTPLSEYPTPVGQQGMGTVAKASKSPNTTKTPSPSQKPSASPTTSGIKPKEPDAPQYVMRKASELEVDTEYKDDKGKVLGKIVSTVGDSPSPEGVVVQDPVTKKYTVMNPDETVSVDNPELQEDSKPDPFERLSKRKNKLKRKIKHLLRAQKHNTQGQPVFEINFNSKKVALASLEGPVQCGFEAETVWPNLGEGNDEDDTSWLDDLFWNRVSDIIYDQEGSGAVDRVEEAYREWLSDESEIVFEFESEVIQELVAERKEDEGYIDDYVNNALDMSEVEEYKSDKLERLEIDDMQDELEEYRDWDDDAWAREYVEMEKEDEFVEWLEEEARNNGEAWDEAWQRATDQYDMDDWCRREHGNSWWSLLGDLDIYLYNEAGEGGGVDAVATLLENWASNNSRSNDVRPGVYHSGSGIDNSYWRVEDDSSIEGDGAKAEIISPVFDSPKEMLKEMKSLFEFMEENNVETNSSTGLHITMSWMGKDWAPTNKLKMAVLLNDKYVAKQYGRESNTFSRSQLKNIEQYMSDIKNDINNEKSLVGLEEIISGGISSGKFSSINFKDSTKNVEQNSLVEFRVAGGDDYHTMMDEVVKTVVRYSAVMEAGHDPEAFKKDYIRSLFRLIKNQDDISTDIQKQTQRQVDPETINDKVLDAFKTLSSKKHYKDSIEKLNQAYSTLAIAMQRKNADPQGELNLGEDDEAETSWRETMQVAQKHFVQAFAILASDVASGQNRAKPKVAQIGALRSAVNEFGLTGGQLWDALQDNDFVQRFPGNHYDKLEKLADAMNTLLKKQDAKAPEADIDIKVGAGNFVMIPVEKHKEIFGDIFGDVKKDPNATISKDDFIIIPNDEMDTVKKARAAIEEANREIEMMKQSIEAYTLALKTDQVTNKAQNKTALDRATDRLAEFEQNSKKYQQVVDQFVSKYKFAPPSVKSNSEPIGPEYRRVMGDDLQALSKRFNIKFSDVQHKESVFAKFDQLPLVEKLALISKVDTAKLNEAWSKKYKSKVSEGSNLSGGELTKYIGTDKDKLPAFLNKVKSGRPFQLVKGGQVTIDPEEHDRLRDTLVPGVRGQLKAKTTDDQLVSLSALAKTAEFGGQASSEESPQDIKFNRGEVAEGYHALAAFVRLIARPTRDINLDDVLAWIPKLENGVTIKKKVEDVENKELADEFWVTISLKKGTWDAFTMPEIVLADQRMRNIVDNVIDDANTDTGRRADEYATNGRYDLVRVIGDGVSGETETKTDIEFENETEKKFRGYSIKAGSVKQIHQVGGGAVTGPGKASAEQRYILLQDELFGVHGRARIADISDARVAYLKAAQDESIKGRLIAQAIAYKSAVKSINKFIKTDDDEKKYVQLLAKAFKYFQARDDDRILLKQFADTKSGSTYILDPKQFDKLHKQGLNLVAVYVDGKANPEIDIIDQDSGKKLVTFRTYKSSTGYMRNYIDKGPLWSSLTNIAKKKVKEGAVPDNSTVKKLREILSKPLLSGDLKGQMNAYVAIPDPSMIRDFRAARAMAGDEHDLRDVVRNYAKTKLHPDVLRKIK